MPSRDIHNEAFKFLYNDVVLVSTFVTTALFSGAYIGSTARADLGLVMVSVMVSVMVFHGLVMVCHGFSWFGNGFSWFGHGFSWFSAPP